MLHAIVEPDAATFPSVYEEWNLDGAVGLCQLWYSEFLNSFAGKLAFKLFLVD